MRYKIQVKKSHYKFQSYLHLNRWISYFYQINSVMEIRTCLKKDTISVIEIGIGDGTVNRKLKDLGIYTTTIDIDSDLKPDIVSSLPDLKKLPNDKYDCVLCCEVLEHITYTDAEKSLKRLSSLCKYAVISVPHKSIYVSTIIRIPLLNAFKFLFQFDLPFIKYKFDGQHYWELGMKNNSIYKFRNTLKACNFKIIKEIRIPEFPYHHYFLLKSN